MIFERSSQAQADEIPRGPTDAHSRTVGQMSMHNALAMATALKPMIMKQGCYTSREFDDFRKLRPQDRLNG